MAFDWPAFLQKHGIDSTDRGPSTARGNIYVQCPFCGQADQGRHMGISLEGAGWGCWRDQTHRGRNPARLIQALLKCSWNDANAIAGRRPAFSSGDALGDMLGGFAEKEKAPARTLKMPEEFRPLISAPRMFIEYMTGRGYDWEEAMGLADLFNMQYAMKGDYAYRIIIPIYDEDQNLVTWTGRSIDSDARLRYKTLSDKPPEKPGKPQALGPLTDYLFDMPTIDEGNRFLIIVEGPFDALNLVGEFKDAYVTCLFGKAVSDAQMDRLSDLKHVYDDIFLVLDPEASADALKLASMMKSLGIIPVPLRGKNDPGAMTRHEKQFLYSTLVGITRMK